MTFGTIKKTLTVLENLNVYGGNYILVQLRADQCRFIPDFSNLSVCFKKCDKNLPILVFSDSLDSSYLENAVKSFKSSNVFSKFFKAEFEVKNGELAVDKTLKRMIFEGELPDYYHNNYIAYHVQNFLKFNAKFRFLRRNDDLDTSCECQKSICE